MADHWSPPRRLGFASTPLAPASPPDEEASPRNTALVLRLRRQASSRPSSEDAGARPRVIAVDEAAAIICPSTTMLAREEKKMRPSHNPLTA